MTTDQQPWDTMLQGLLRGDEQAFAEFWRRYGGRLHQIAARRLPAHLTPRVGPEDVVQSVCRTFFRRMNEGRLEVEKGQRLWPLLCAITLNKVRMQIRFHLQDKRNPGRERSLDKPQSSEDEGGRSLELPADSADPQEAAAFLEQLQRVFDALDDDQQQVLKLKLEGADSREIAECLKCSTRTVRRITNRMRDRLGEILLSDLTTDDVG